MTIAVRSFTTFSLLSSIMVYVNCYRPYWDLCVRSNAYSVQTGKTLMSIIKPCKLHACTFLEVTIS